MSKQKSRDFCAAEGSRADARRARRREKHRFMPLTGGEGSIPFALRRFRRVKTEYGGLLKWSKRSHSKCDRPAIPVPGFESLILRHVVADCISFAATFLFRSQSAQPFIRMVLFGMKCPCFSTYGQKQGKRELYMAAGLRELQKNQGFSENCIGKPEFII